MQKKFFSIIMVVLVALSLAACSSNKNTTENPAPSVAKEEITSTKAGGEIRIAIQNDVDGLDPHRTVSASTFQVTNNIFDTLIGVKPDGNLVPRLAEKWEASEDGLTWTLTLASNVKFHDGKPFTAADVVYSFERLKAEDSPRAKEYGNISKVKADGDHKVIFTLESKDATFLSSLANPWAAIVANGADAELKTKPNGTGPYELVEWNPQQNIVLKKNENYFAQDKPSIDKVTFEVIPEPTTLLANLKTGKIDIATIQGEQVAQLESVPNLKIETAPLNNVQVLALNNDQKPLNDVRVRQAIAKAIDKQTIIDGANWGYGTPIGSHLAPTSPYFIDTTNTHSYDIQAAKALLKEAGYENGFKMTLALPKPYPLHIQTGQIIAEQLKQIGIDLDIQTVEWGKWVKDIYLGRKYDMTVISHTGRLDPYAMLGRYESTSNENYFNYKNAAVDKALTQAKVELDEQKRMDLFKTVQETLAKEVPAIYIQSPDSIVAMKKEIQGFNVYPIDIIDLKTIQIVK